MLISYSGVLYKNRKEFLELRSDYPIGFYYLISNLGLYLLGLIYNILGLVLVRHFEFFIRVGYWFTGLLMVFSLCGFSVTKGMIELVHTDSNYSKLLDLLITMICIRLLFYALICVFFGFISIAACCAIASGQQHIITQHQL